MIKIKKFEMILLFNSGVCFGWATDTPKNLILWFGFIGSLFGALVCIFDKDRQCSIAKNVN